jgi:DNA-binding transcriptional ArsR family regulator
MDESSRPRLTSDEASRLRLTSVEALRAMAHPLRMLILGSLRIDGPATSAILARRLETDSGQTSHHLRLLARAGFVTEAPELGKGPRGRERWWKAGSASTAWPDLPGEYSAVGVFEDAARAAWEAMIATYRSQAWSPEWRAAAGGGDSVIRTTPAGLAALQDELHRVIEAHDRGDESGAETVVVVVQAIPRRVGQ